jgi:serine phosphatase RsbU (regulator of sigma subunit)
MVIVLAGFLCWDYFSEWRAQLAERRDALHGEAQAILQGARYLEDRPLAERQAYIDDLCGRMRENVSPGHHIVLFTEGEALQARSHGRQSPEMLAAVTRAAQTHGTAQAPQGEIVVGVAAGGGMTVAVAERVTDIASIVRRNLVRGTLTMLALGAALAVVANIAIGRYVTSPVRRIVEAVRSLKRGETGAQVGLPRSRELAFLAGEFNAMSAALADAERQRRAQLDKARRMQRNLLPSELPVLGLGIATVHEPAEEVTGDFFQTRITPGGDVVLCLADAAGHGVPAAMLASMISVVLDEACAQAEGPSAMISHLSDRLAGATLPEDFATVILLQFIARETRFSYASAAHEPCYLLHGGGELLVLEPTGPPAGIMAGTTWEEREMPWGPEWRLVLATDGVAEAADRDGRAFGRPRLRRLLEESMGLSAEEVADTVRTEVREQSGGTPHDDFTLIVIDAGRSPD